MDVLVVDVVVEQAEDSGVVLSVAAPPDGVHHRVAGVQLRVCFPGCARFFCNGRRRSSDDFLIPFYPFRNWCFLGVRRSASITSHPPMSITPSPGHTSFFRQWQICQQRRGFINIMFVILQCFFFLHFPDACYGREKLSRLPSLFFWGEVPARGISPFGHAEC